MVQCRCLSGADMSAAEELERLAALKASGSLSNEEFELLKRKLLYSESSENPARSTQLKWSDVKLRQKWWFQALSTLILPIVGIPLILLIKAYFKKRDGTVAKRSIITKSVFVALALFVWGLNLARLSFSEADYNFAGTSEIPTCDSIESRGALSDAIENSVESRQSNYRLLDLQNVVEVESVAGELRRCNADLVLNSGTETTGYSIRNGSPGVILVEISPEPFEVLTQVTKVVGEQPSTASEEPDASSGVLRLASRALTESQHEKLIIAAGPDRLAALSWVVISSIDLGNDQAALLVEVPSQTDEPNDCHACAPALSLIVFDAVHTESPTVAGTSPLLLEGIGEWGETAPVSPVALPNGLPAFAFAWSFFAQGVQETGCAVITLDGTKTEPEQFAGTEFDCTPI